MASRGVNKVILIGNLGNDPDVRTSQNGVAIASISVATSESWKDKNTGQTVERTEWHRVVCYQRLAEIVGQYLRKGSKVYIEGRLQTREWEKDGVKRYTTEIVANEMQMLDGRNGADNGGGHHQPQAAPQPQQAAHRPQQAPQQRQAYNGGGNNHAAPPQSGFAGFDDDIPF